MKHIGIVISLLLLIGGGYFLLQSDEAKDPAEILDESDEVALMTKTLMDSPVAVTPIEHASMVLEWGEVVLYNDPVGGVSRYGEQPTPTIVLLTDVHGDHLDIETLEVIATPAVLFVAPQAVFDELPPMLQAQTTVVANGETAELAGLSITGIAAYNLPEGDPDNRHVKGRGNGYVVSDGQYRVYIAGDTEDVSEMRALTDIDMAFVPMNLPYTMDETAAAAGVLAFMPTQVYPYHFRTPEGYTDVFRFKELVEAGSDDIAVVILDWYPDTIEDGV